MLTSTTTTTAFARLGALSARSLASQPCAARPCSSLVSSLAQRQLLTAAKPASPFRYFSSNTTTRPVAAALTTLTPRRNTSTTTARPGASSTPSLDWNTFFALRKSRRRIQLISSICTTLVGGGAGAMLLVNQDLDWLLGKIPMDPFFSLGLITMCFAGLGWLAGPSLGATIFYAAKRGNVKQSMAIKEAEFFARIKKNRVDPASSSVQNPVPDFYGEKISSVAGYRRWLKDQRAFMRKRGPMPA